MFVLRSKIDHFPTDLSLWLRTKYHKDVVICRSKTYAVRLGRLNFKTDVPTILQEKAIYDISVLLVIRSTIHLGGVYHIVWYNLRILVAIYWVLSAFPSEETEFDGYNNALRGSLTKQDPMHVFEE